MGDNEAAPMSFDARREFLTGLFTTWYALEQGRTKPNADDKKRGKIVANQSADMFHFYADQRRRHAAPAVAA